MDEGYIKFNADWENIPIDIPKEQFRALEGWRTKLYRLGLIGMYRNGIGYGNISSRNIQGGFFVTGSATGNKRQLAVGDYSWVSEWEFKNNSVKCAGQTIASSESLTHAAIYRTLPEIGAIIHVHSMKLWEQTLDVLPTTGRQVAYGTPKMAEEMFRLLASENTLQKGCMVMGGHEEGLITFGKDLDEAGKRVIDIYDQFSNKSKIV